MLFWQPNSQHSLYSNSCTFLWCLRSEGLWGWIGPHGGLMSASVRSVSQTAPLPIWVATSYSSPEPHGPVRGAFCDSSYCQMLTATAFLFFAILEPCMLGHSRLEREWLIQQCDRICGVMSCIESGRASVTNTSTSRWQDPAEKQMCRHIPFSVSITSLVEECVCLCVCGCVCILLFAF